jgi:Uma2 family endonuclease
MAVTQLMTAEQFQEMPDDPGKRYELVNGEVVEVPFANHNHGRIVMALMRMLDTFVLDHDLGEVLGDGNGFIITRAPDSVRGPDISFIAQERVPEDAFPGVIPFAPDLAVEIVSPSDRASEVHDKVYQYVGNGVRLVWVLWPTTRSVSVFTSGNPVTELGPDDELDGGDVLPGFHVRVGELFETRKKR